MSDRPERARRPSLRRFNRGVLLVVGLLIALVVVAIVMANPSRPDPEELKRVVLKVSSIRPGRSAFCAVAGGPAGQVLKGREPLPLPPAPAK